MARKIKKAEYSPIHCEDCEKKFIPAGARSKRCPKCADKRKRIKDAERTPRTPRGEGRGPGRPPGRGRGRSSKEMIAALVDAAKAQGDLEARLMVEAATRELLGQNMKLRDQLIRSRHENQKLRAKLELTDLDKEMRKKGE